MHSSQYPIDECKRLHEIFDRFLDCAKNVERRLSLAFRYENEHKSRVNCASVCASSRRPHIIAGCILHTSSKPIIYVDPIRTSRRQYPANRSMRFAAKDEKHQYQLLLQLQHFVLPRLHVLPSSPSLNPHCQALLGVLRVFRVMRILSWQDLPGKLHTMFLSNVCFLGAHA